MHCMDGCLREDRAMSTVEHNYVIIDGEGEGSGPFSHLPRTRPPTGPNVVPIPLGWVWSVARPVGRWNFL